MIYYWNKQNASKMMMNILVENKVEIHLISIVSVGDDIESGADISNRHKNWYLFEVVEYAINKFDGQCKKRQSGVVVSRHK
jgi:hypothetical protein